MEMIVIILNNKISWDVNNNKLKEQSKFSLKELGIGFISVNLIIYMSYKIFSKI